MQPSLIVALGATAARALTGRALPIETNRGRIIDRPDAPSMMITVHPSYLLRLPEESQPREYRRLVDDLARIAPFIERHGPLPGVQPPHVQPPH